MSYSRPSVFPEWATTLSNDGPLGGPNRVEPSGGDKATGFTYPQQAPREWFNWLLYTNYTWLAYLDQQITAGGNSVFAHNAASSSGLNFAYAGGVFYNQYTKAVTIVSSGSVTLAAADTNYVVYRPGTGVTSVVAPPASNLTKGDVILWKVDTNATDITGVQDLRNPASYVIPYLSATDKILGRSSSGAGIAEEITCTSAARSLLDDATVADMRTTLSAAKTGAVADSGITSGTNKLVGRATAGTGALEEIEIGDGLLASGGSLKVNGIASHAHVRATHTSPQTIPVSTATVVQYANEEYDTLSEYNTSTYRYTATKDGYYSVSARLQADPDTASIDDSFQIDLYVNGSEKAHGFSEYCDNGRANRPYASVIHTTVYLTAGDYIDIRCTQNVQTNLDTAGNGITNYLTIDRLL